MRAKGDNVAALDRRPATVWTRADTGALVAVTLVAALLRLPRLTATGVVFDESFYVRDACWYVHAAPGTCLPGEESPGHPPLGKWLIGFGIRLLGLRPAGWRLAPLLAGTLTVALLYLLARRLLLSRAAATLAAGFLAVDFLHVVHSRVAMLEVFVALFGVAAFLCVSLDRRPARGSRRLLFERPWLLLAGVTAGGAVASKWSGLPILFAVWAFALARAPWGAVGPGRAGAVRAVLREEGPTLLLALVVVPMLVYVVAHVGRVEGALVALPWERRSWVRSFLSRQGWMLDFHRALADAGDQHPYASRAWSWPLVRRPVLYFFKVDNGRYAQILALGSPLVWWSSLAAAAAALTRWVRRRAGQAERVVLLGLAAGWGPWLLLSPGRTYMFLFYLLPAVPFLMLALGCVAERLLLQRRGRAAVGAFALASVALFAFYYPVLTALPLSPAAWERRVLFGYESCGIPRPPRGSASPPHQPFLERRTPPTGWCWI